MSNTAMEKIKNDFALFGKNVREEEARIKGLAKSSQVAHQLFVKYEQTFGHKAINLGDAVYEIARCNVIRIREGQLKLWEK